MKEIVLAVGGTGGHIYPAAALAVHIRDSRPDTEVYIFGAAGGQEETIAVKNGIKFRAVKVARLPGNKFSPAMARLPLDIASAVAGAGRALRETGAATVLGFGGYVSFPTVAAARLAGIPVFLHEQNTIMGKSNRLMSKVARGVFTSFDETRGAPAGRTHWTGNPCRFEGRPAPEKSFARTQLGLAPDAATLLVFGGSQGAVSLNKAAVDFAATRARESGIQILHIAGPKNYESLKKQYAAVLKAGGLKVTLLSYCDTMDLAYAATDLAVCRAGATTITELMCLGVPAVLVPYPFAAEGHQEKNALYMRKRGAAEMLEDSELAGAFTDTAAALLRGGDKLKKMSENTKKLYRAGAAENMARLLLESAAPDGPKKRNAA